MQLTRSARRTRQVVPEKSSLERCTAAIRCRIRHGRLTRLECPSLNEVDIEVSIVVVVEEGDAGGDDLRKVVLARHAVDVDEVEPCVPGCIDEPRVSRG